MDNIVLILVCLIAGIVLKYLKVFPENAFEVLNGFIIYVSLPAITLLYIPEMKFTPDILYPAAVSWIIFIAGFLFFSGYQKLFRVDKSTIGALVLTCAMGNTSFVGFPILRAFWGEESIKTGIIIDQAGTFFVLSSLGIFAASYYSFQRSGIKSLAKRILNFPPFIVFIAALILSVFNYHHTETVRNILQKLGNTIFILSLVSVGLQLSLNLRGVKIKDIFTGLFFKLIVAPSLIFFLYVYILGIKSEMIKICITEAAMPPIITGAIVAMNFKLNPKLVGQLLGIGIPLSLITLIIWYYILKML